VKALALLLLSACAISSEPAPEARAVRAVDVNNPDYGDGPAWVDAGAATVIEPEGLTEAPTAVKAR
jgi:hypothetical protein